MSDPKLPDSQPSEPNLPILQFLLHNYKNFNSRATRDATLAYWRHIQDGGRMFWAVDEALADRRGEADAELR